MSIVFVWQQQYAVGISELDKQHRFLFDLGNKIQRIEENDQVNKVVMALYNYAKTHFKAEEDFMFETGFPGLSNHKQLHEKFIADLKTIAEKQGDLLIEEVTLFLQNWLLDHILNEDRKYLDFSIDQKES